MLTVTNVGDPCSTLSWTISGLPWWLTANPATGISGTSTMLSANIGGMAAATYNAPLTFIDGPTSVTGAVTVNLTVKPVPCGDFTRMCGSVSDAEFGNPQPNQVLELRDVKGNILKTQTTSSATGSVGSYLFTGLTQGATYYISPVVGRSQVASPQAMDYAPQDAAGNANLNFTIRGIPSTVTVTGDTGTFVLLTPTYFNGTTPPPVSSGGATPYYSGAIGSSGQASLNVSPGSAYFIACWKNQNGAYNRTSNNYQTAMINSGTPLNPGQPIRTPCPSN
jgi:hypothetical protein